MPYLAVAQIVIGLVTMNTITYLFVAGITVAAYGCGASIAGGGGGSGSGGAGGTTASTSTSPASTVGAGGNSGGLGECEMQGGSATASSGGPSMCGTDYACDAGNVNVECSSNGTTTTCTCTLNNVVKGTCDGDFTCTFPQSCCFGVLDGFAEPNPGPYGTCNTTSGSAAAGGGGETSCDSSYDCDGGSLSIHCDGFPNEAATCKCKDGQGFLLGTCEQSTAVCQYESSCCYDIFN